MRDVTLRCCLWHAEGYEHLVAASIVHDGNSHGITVKYDRLPIEHGPHHAPGMSLRIRHSDLIARAV
jgi:hypothetical protein